jgi:hypothetical protein
VVSGPFCGVVRKTLTSGNATTAHLPRPGHELASLWIAAFMRQEPLSVQRRGIFITPGELAGFLPPEGGDPGRLRERK